MLIEFPPLIFSFIFFLPLFFYVAGWRRKRWGCGRSEIHGGWHLREDQRGIQFHPATEPLVSLSLFFDSPRSLSLSLALCFSFSTTSAQLPLSSFLVYSSLPSRVRVSRRSTIIDADACLGCLLPIFPRLSSFVPLLPVSRLFQNPPRWRCCTPIASKSLIRERKVGIVCSRRPLLSRLLITRRTFRTLAGFSRKPDTRITGRSPVENLTQRFAANLQWLTNVYFDAYQRIFSRICYAYRIKHFETLFNTVTRFKSNDYIGNNWK